MSKTTLTKLIRTFDAIGNSLVRRDKKLEQSRPFIKNCSICGEPMILAQGQIAYFHSECRKMRTGIIRNAKKYKHND